MSKRIKPVGNDEPCPCGSGKTYRACCLRGQVRYYRDEDGETVKFSLDCLPGSSPAIVPESPEGCDHDCEHCDRHSDSPDIAVMINEDGELMTMVDIEEFSPREVKLLISHIAVIQAKLVRALADPTNDESLRGKNVLVLLVARDEDEDLIFGGERTFSGVPHDMLESAVGGMEKMKLDLLLDLLHTGLSAGFEFLDPTNDDE